MGRYEDLNDASKDVVNCLLPGIAANFELGNVLDVIPQDIRMRTWDTARKEHVIDQSEDDPRNWGLQFLKDLVTISRVKQGKLTEFQADLRIKVQKHGTGHPWARLADIKELKVDYTAPPPTGNDDSQPQEAIDVSDDSSSDGSYLEELVEKERSGPKKRGRPSMSARKQEHYQSRRQERMPRKSNVRLDRANPPKRLRRSSSSGWERPDKSRRHGEGRRSGYRHPDSDMEGPCDGNGNIGFEIKNFHNMPLNELEAQLQVAEAELKATKLRLKVIEARGRSTSKPASRATPKAFAPKALASSGFTSNGFAPDGFEEEDEINGPKEEVLFLE